MKQIASRPLLIVISAALLILSSCSVQKKIDTSAKQNILNTADLKLAHVGISIYEPITGRYWYNYQGDKYFTPASNTKIFTCYAGMKYLGDSLTGLAYTENNNDIFIQGTGDPTLLHPEYKNQPVISFLQHTNKNIFIVDDIDQVFCIIYNIYYPILIPIPRFLRTTGIKPVF